jgi:hypothetical protein
LRSLILVQGSDAALGVKRSTARKWIGPSRTPSHHHHVGGREGCRAYGDAEYSAYHTIDELQTDLDTWLVDYNQCRLHQGRWCFGKTPMQTFLDAPPLAKEKIMAA